MAAEPSKYSTPTRKGRLVLADVLARSADDEPALLIDVATLTGAQLVALGRRVSAVMASDDAVREAVVDAATRAGEAMWPMPLPGELRRSLDSTVADIANVAPDKNAAMLVAGVFLREFVPNGVRWAHLDIAGPSFNDGRRLRIHPQGRDRRGHPDADPDRRGRGGRAAVTATIDVAGGYAPRAGGHRPAPGQGRRCRTWMTPAGPGTHA